MLRESFGNDVLYWRNNKKKECDYVLKKGERLTAIEAKSGSARNDSGYQEFKDMFKHPLG